LLKELFIHGQAGGLLDRRSIEAALVDLIFRHTLLEEILIHLKISSSLSSFAPLFLVVATSRRKVVFTNL